jgi:hypothetical protein
VLSESNPPRVNARSFRYSDTDSIETLTLIPGPDSFETLTPIPGPVSVPRSPSGSANAKDNEGNGAGGLWEPLIRIWE